jgi:trans-2-enoyl-CoA reductase
MTKDDYVENAWNAVSNNDMFTLGDYASYKNLVFNLGFYSQKENINLRLKNLKLKVYGVK